MRSHRRVWLIIISSGYVVAALVVGLWPTPVDAGIRTQIASVLGALHHAGAPSTLDYSTLEFTANIGFFVPVGALICLLLPARRWFFAIPIGAALSGMIELSQLLLLPARFASWNDVLANTTGTIVGVILVLMARGIRRLVRSAPDVSPANPATSAERRRDRDRSRDRSSTPRRG
ncbi:VanZ family protein [Lysinimonas soli]|uniref:VanZ family protein n=1 Tax=Lysinimonas soli TaxID=1074233 RepID=A0ABW0NWB0_9MICO